MAFTVTNNLDDLAIYLGLTRLSGETDELFSSRIKRFSKIRYGTDYCTSVSSIAEQVGLSMSPVAKISCIHPFTCVVGQDTIELESFPVSGGNGSYVRIFINFKSTSSEMADKITERLAGSEFNLQIINQPLFSSITRESLFRNSNAKIVKEVVSYKRTLLENKFILPGSLSSNSSLIVNKKASIQDLKYDGDYFLDHDTNYLEINSDPSDVFNITFKKYNDYHILYSSQFNLMPLKTYLDNGISDSFVNLLDTYLAGKCLGA